MAVGRSQFFWRSIIAAACLALLTFLIVIADRPLSEVSRAFAPWVVGVFSAFSEAGDSKWSLVPAGLAVILFSAMRRRETAPKRRRLWAWCIAAPGFLFLCVALSGILVNVLKVIFGRARPAMFDREGIYGFDPFAFDASFHSFPSGHANTIIAIGLVLALFFPRQRLAILVMASVMAYSRVVVGAHYLSDVIAGGLVAALTTGWIAAWFTRRGWVFELDRHGRRRLQAPGRWLKRRARAILGRALASAAKPLRSALGRPAGGRQATRG